MERMIIEVLVIVLGRKLEDLIRSEAIPRMAYMLYCMASPTLSQFGSWSATAMTDLVGFFKKYWTGTDWAKLAGMLRVTMLYSRAKADSLPCSEHFRTDIIQCIELDDLVSFSFCMQISRLIRKWFVQDLIASLAFPPLTRVKENEPPRSKL